MTRQVTSAPSVFNDDVKSLLDAANQTSAQVAILHLAFMAVCAYVLVVVFGTTDLDLLIGKGVKLPLVDVEVPIAGFYASAPYLIVLVHFNLLLQLQLLSRKLFALDAVVPTRTVTGGVRERLHTFPYTYYLIVQTGPLIRNLLGAVVTITVLILPLVTLLILQFRFLPYQEWTITWAQRLAIWIDVVFVVTLWPVIMDRSGSWSSFLRKCWNSVPTFKSLMWMLLWIAALISLFSARANVIRYALFVASAVVIANIVSRAIVRAWHWYRRQHTSPAITNEESLGQRGIWGFALVVAIGLPLPIALLVRGEPLEKWLGHPIFSQGFLQVRHENEFVRDDSPKYRHLDLHGQIMLAKPAGGDGIARIRLRGRSLLGADLGGSILSGVDLKNAELQGANLSSANLQGADLSSANLQGANLFFANLQAANLSKADLRGANLSFADLRGANLSSADLRSADIHDARVQGANLGGTNVEGVDSRGAQYSSEGEYIVGDVLDMRGAIRKDLTKEELDKLRQIYDAAGFDRVFHTDRFHVPSENPFLFFREVPLVSSRPAPPLRQEPATTLVPNVRPAGKLFFRSCLNGGPEQWCEQEWKPEHIKEFRGALHIKLAYNACESTAIARGLLTQVGRTKGLITNLFYQKDDGPENSRSDGLLKEIAKLLNEPECVGFYELSEYEKDWVYLNANS